MVSALSVNALDSSTIRDALEHHLTYTLGTTSEKATPSEQQKALALVARELTIDSLNQTESNVSRSSAKRVYYLSMEFLIGRLTHNNLSNLKLLDIFSKAAAELGWQLQDVLEAEPDPSLGNGGLGRLAACFLDSLATLGYPGYGYGINFEYGLFRQSFVNGEQREVPDNWMRHQSAWQIERQQSTVNVPCFGRIDHNVAEDGSYNPQWVDWKVIVGVPYDMPVVGYGDSNTNYLRLFSAQAPSDFDMNLFNDGNYLGAFENTVTAETVSKVLYPSDTTDSGKELRLLQEYFFVACAIRDIVRQLRDEGEPISALPDKVAIQLNDTHPALAVAELMRLLVDEEALPWNTAWNLTQKTLAYTNHTLLPEALEKWPVALVERVLPRHTQIIYEINRIFLEEVRTRYPGDENRIETMSIIEEGDHRMFRMANLCIVGSHSVNGVAAMHSELVKSQLVPEFYEFSPEKFNNKTNGVTQRRWLLGCNTGLSDLISGQIDDGWISDFQQIKKIERLATDVPFQDDFRAVKQKNKHALANEILKLTRVTVDPASLFDVQIKRIHEYKRQLLNAMHIAHLYHSIIDDGLVLDHSRTFIFSGKAAPGYATAKLIIKYINALAALINNDRRVNDQLKVVYIPDYRVSVAEKIIPAADLSEQISTAGFEASGTGNMKLTINGALTIGTLDGANVEICEEVGSENIYIFGNTAEELMQLRHEGYRSTDWYQSNPDIRRVVDHMTSGVYGSRFKTELAPLVDTLLSHNDYFMHFPDFSGYLDAQAQVSKDWADQSRWTEKAILNVARSHKFSSDRSIEDYANDIWSLNSIKNLQRKAA